MNLVAFKIFVILISAKIPLTFGSNANVNCEELMSRVDELLSEVRKDEDITEREIPKDYDFYEKLSQMYVLNREFMSELDPTSTLSLEIKSEQERIKELLTYAFWRVSGNKKFKDFMGYNKLATEDRFSISAGAISLALDKRDLNKLGKDGKVASFVTYYFILLRQGILRGIAQSNSVNYTTYKQILHFRAIFNELQKQLTREPTAEEVALTLDWPLNAVEKIAEISKAIKKKYVNLDDIKLSAASKIKDHPEFTETEIKKYMAKLEEVLTPQEFDILRRRYMDEQSLSELATLYGFSTEGIRKITLRAAERARRILQP